MKIKEKVIEAIRENIQWKGMITEDMDLIRDLGIDSFDMLMIINTLEEEFSIVVEEEQLENLKTVGDIIKRLGDLFAVNA
jgi:acyl carrier protein